MSHRRCILRCAAVFQIGGNAGRTKRVVADRRADAGCARAAPHHRISVCLRQGPRAQLRRAARDCREQGTIRLIAQAGLLQIRVQVHLERAVTGHLVLLAAFFTQAHPQAPALHVDIVDPHRERRTHSCKRKHHQPDQRPIPETNGCRDIDAVEQLPGFARIEHRGLALARCITRSAHGRGRIVRHDLAGDEPVEQVADRRELLLDGRRRRRLRLQFDLGRHMQRLHDGNRRHAGAGASREKVTGRASIRTPCMRVAGRRREELEESHAGPLASGGDNYWRRDAA